MYESLEKMQSQNENQEILNIFGEEDKIRRCGRPSRASFLIDDQTELTKSVDTGISMTRAKERQRQVGIMNSSRPFQCLLTICIMVHVVLSVYETDQRASKIEPSAWQTIVEKIFVSVYIIDLVMRVYSQRRDFFAHTMNVFDLLIVVSPPPSLMHKEGGF